MAAREPRNNPSSALRLVLLIILSIGLMIADHRTEYVQTVRSALAIFVTPIQAAATLPHLVRGWFNDFFTTEQDYRDAYTDLQHQHMKLRARLQRLEALELENDSLRRLLAASGQVPDQVLMAELVEVSLDPFSRKILINRGITDGIYVGQPVLDPNGVMGQVTHTMPFTSAVTLITDSSHAIPVQVQRNGLRGIVFGVGKADDLKVSYLTHNADIREGDVLVTSGMGGRFPPGYPVATVKTIVRNTSEAFLNISAAPVARLDHAKQVLLVWQGLDVVDRRGGNDDG
ncbi:MAG: rod shape-determining protein MreC [Gammaproteobacteria bacterium]|nr:rod shape-determining protein MreC [Gammaproteobacteria bacterium]